MPIWSKTKVSNDNDNLIYEVELENPNNLFTTEGVIDVKKANEYSKLSLFKLVLIKDKNKQTINGGYMNILASKEYNKVNIQDVHYKTAVGFTGKIQFYTISGNLKNGWYYVDGKIEKMFSRLSSINLSANKLSSRNQFSISKESLMKDPVPSDGDCGVAPVYGTICFQVGGFYESCETQVIGWNTFPCPTNPPNDGGGDGGGDSGGMEPGSGGGGGATTPEPPRDIIDNLTDPCLKKALQKARNANFTNIAQSIIKKLDGDKKVKVSFADQNQVLNSNGQPVEGKTTGYNFNSVYGEFSCSILLSIESSNNSTQEYTVGTIVHEIIHAYLQYAAGSTLNHANNHEEMAKNYVKPIAGFLTSAFPSLNPKDATAIAWGGLQGTSLWKASYEKDSFDYGNNGQKMTFGEMKGLENAHKGGFAENSSSPCSD